MLASVPCVVRRALALAVIMSGDYTCPASQISAEMLALCRHAAITAGQGWQEWYLVVDIHFILLAAASSNPMMVLM